MNGAGEDATLEWFGATTFRLQARGLTIFLDTWLERPSVLPSYLTIEDAGHVDYIFISHAHFDHLPGCDRLAKRTGAVVVANGEAINVLREAGVPEDQLLPVAGGERIPLFAREDREAAQKGKGHVAPGPPGAPLLPDASLAVMAVHAWPSLHCLLPGTSHADIPDSMDTGTVYSGSAQYACTIDITRGMRYGLLKLDEIVPREQLDAGEKAFIKANFNGRPFDGTAAEAATHICKWLGEPPQVIWCLHDDAPIKPWRIDTGAAERMIEQTTRSKVRHLTPATKSTLFLV
ncbi:hypothetical protein LTR56_012907 [Elasticomyces elasticus]|nr:hypothetical protein LTR56_012907 [Elasticomyces elasticus]KAK3650833.1 hypothetical protein LTR22_012432 [Elasticomyces elasticus]KAK4918537.1 hypothetical protein LTR49_013770 [Elasticomyces elasticus]KAK5757825.1 hypothetical protein LTS12_012009 [Elasticomyces elasticus]